MTYTPEQDTARLDREDAKTELRDERQQYKLDDSPCELDEADDKQQRKLDEEENDNEL